MFAQQFENLPWVAYMAGDGLARSFGGPAGLPNWVLFTLAAAVCYWAWRKGLMHQFMQPGPTVKPVPKKATPDPIAPPVAHATHDDPMLAVLQLVSLSDDAKKAQQHDRLFKAALSAVELERLKIAQEEAAKLSPINVTVTKGGS